MKTLALTIITTLFFSGCFSARVNAKSDAKHHAVGIKTKLLKF